MQEPVGDHKDQATINQTFEPLFFLTSYGI